MLEAVYGGDCGRIGRLRWNIELGEGNEEGGDYELTDATKADPRWSELKRHVETVEEVLKKAGKYVEWTPQRLKLRSIREKIRAMREVGVVVPLYFADLWRLAHLRWVLLSVACFSTLSATYSAFACSL